MDMANRLAQELLAEAAMRDLLEKEERVSQKEDKRELDRRVQRNRAKRERAKSRRRRAKS